METLGVIVPQIKQAEQIERQIKDGYYLWRDGYIAAHPVPPIENIKFTHNPNWRNELFSFQNAHDCNTVFWKATRVVVTFATAAGALGSIGMF